MNDDVAEWLRRQPAKLMGFARVGSNPTVVDFLPSFTRETKNKPQAGFEPTTFRLLFVRIRKKWTCAFCML